MKKNTNKSNNNIFAFIDSQNLYLGIKSQRWDLDYKKFFRYLTEKYQVAKIYLYIGYLKKNQSLYNYLEKIGYRLVFKNTNKYGKLRDQIKGNIDVDLTVDSIRKLNEYDKAIFVSADGDFMALYDYLVEEKGKDILIMVPNKHKYSSFLLKYRKQLRFMNDLKVKLGKCKLKKGECCL